MNFHLHSTVNQFSVHTNKHKHTNIRQEIISSNWRYEAGNLTSKFFLQKNKKMKMNIKLEKSACLYTMVKYTQHTHSYATPPDADKKGLLTAPTECLRGVGDTFQHTQETLYNFFSFLFFLLCLLFFISFKTLLRQSFCQKSDIV